MAQRPVPKVVPSTSASGTGVVRNVPGNHFDKHGSESRAVQWLMDRFHATVLDAVRSLPHGSILDAGCGEGRTTAILAEATGSSVVGVELELSALSLAPSTAPTARFVGGSVYSLPFEDGTFDTVIATEVLEHLDTPSAAVTEMLRVARHGVVVTVPHEPWWRAGNMARGKYLRDLGNTPGHVQHWTRSGLRSFLRSHSGSVSITGVMPWTLAVLRKVAD